MNEDKIVATYDFYTLDQAREIVLAEMRHNRLVRRWKIKQRRKQRKAERTALFISRLKSFKQKLSGLLFIIIGILLPVLTYDATFSVISVLLGICLITTKKEVMK